MEEEHTIVRILISRIGRCKEKLKARRGPAQWTYSHEALTDRYIGQVSFREKIMRRAEGLIKKCQERTKDGMAKE
jgi:hypothetical protein